MSPWLDAMLAGWVDIVGGRQSARSIHFIIAWLLVAFVLIHVFQVIVTGLWNNLRSMITGRYRGAVHETRRVPFDCAGACAAALSCAARWRPSRTGARRAATTCRAPSGCPKILESVEPLNEALAEADRPQRHGAGVRAESDRSPTFRSNGSDMARIRSSTTRGCQSSSPITRSTSAGCAKRRASSRSRSCARCRRARRSRVTTASRAGAPSPSGRARASRRCSTRQGQVPGALRDVLLRRSDVVGRHRSLLREHRLRRRASRADDPRLRPQRRSRCPCPNGAPIRLRVERQLGYKHAKFVTGIEFVSIVREDRRRQGRLLGGPGLPVVRGHLRAVAGRASSGVHLRHASAPCVTLCAAVRDRSSACFADS